MTGTRNTHWFGSVRPPDATDVTDAELLQRFITEREELAFEKLLHRHGPMVLAVCRKRLGSGPDADDAFQAVFIVLARDAGKLTDPNALPGWLFRVAYLISLKAVGKRAAKIMGPLPDDVPEPPSVTPDDELMRNLHEEVAALPEKFRTVVALCLVQGRTNREAAGLLGVPIGTVDSRLSTARKRLQDKLIRRGIALTGVVTLDSLLAVRATAGGMIGLIPLTQQLVFDFLHTTGTTALPPNVAELIHGVTTMGTSKLKLFTILGLTMGVVGGTGVGIFHATARDDQSKPAKPTLPAVAKPEAIKPTPPKADAQPAAGKASAVGSVTENTRKLDEPTKIQTLEGVLVRDVLAQLTTDTGLTHRIDPDILNVFQVKPYDVKLEIGSVAGLSVRDVLTEVIAALSSEELRVPNDRGTCKLGIRVRGNQVLITRGFRPQQSPDAEGNDVQKFVTEEERAEVQYGPTVGLAVESLPLTEFIQTLRDRTGANIVLDVRIKGEVLGTPITMTVNDTRLRTVLKLTADMCGLVLRTTDNVFYLTTGGES